MPMLALVIRWSQNRAIRRRSSDLQRLPINTSSMTQVYLLSKQTARRSRANHCKDVRAIVFFSGTPSRPDLVVRYPDR
jgi:hypothetical protein